ncbi:MAG: DUF502 domain-containing protein [Candidatus Latescibacterota bacterium]
MAGLTVIAPLWFTAWVLVTLFQWADGFSAPLIHHLARTLGHAGFHVPGLGFVLTFVILWLVGTVATNVVGKRLLQSAREAILRLPMVRTIYSPVHHLVETMASPDKTGFKQVVLVEYPREGMWTLGFLAGDVPRAAGQTPAHSIFVPTAPNPTTGFMLIVPPEQLRHTSLTTDQAFQMIISAGVVVPGQLALVSADAPRVEVIRRARP